MPSGLKAGGHFFVCPVSLPEKTNLTFPNPQSRIMHLLRSLRASGDSTSVLPETDVCSSVIRSCREHVPALRIGSASGWARGERGYVPGNYLRVRTLRNGTPFVCEPGPRR